MNFFRYLKKIILDDFKLVILYIIFVLFFSVFYITFEWSEGLRKNDKYLDMAVRTVPLLLEDDFHDRALGPESISFEEELKNRKKINSFVKTTNLEWVYTLVNYRGKYYFSAPTVTDEEAEEIERWYFYPYEDVPRFFNDAYTEDKTVFVTYTDQWGTYRSIVKPIRSPGNILYLVCADMEISKVRGIILKQFANSLVIFIFFIFLSSAVIIRLIMDRRKIIAINRELLFHKNNLTELVDNKTSDIIKINEQLLHTEQQLKLTIAEGGMGILKWNSGNDVISKGDSDSFLQDAGLLEYFPLTFKELVEIYINPDDIDIVNIFLDDMKILKKNSAQVEFRLKNNDGNWIWISFLGKRFESENPDSSEIIFILFEIIDERKKRELILEKKAVHDSLTGIYNREFYLDFINALNINKRLNDFPLTVCYIDINGLKEVNDMLGHTEGDEMLVAFCSFVIENLRKTDIFCRIGGDEFLILCPGISNTEFRNIWSRIIATADIYNSESIKPYRISFSHGVIELSHDDISMPAEKIIALADEMMYLEKKILKKESSSIIRNNDR